MWGVSLKCWLTSFTTENWPCIIKYVVGYVVYFLNFARIQYGHCRRVTNYIFEQFHFIAFRINAKCNAFLLYQQKMTLSYYILLNFWSCHKSAWTYSISIILLKYVLQYVNLIYCASIFHICTQHARICNIKIELLHTALTTYINGNVCK